MLTELPDVRQEAGAPRRRWFRDDMFDLIVWQDEGRPVEGFQLCYRSGADEHALTWWRGRGFSHKRVDDGEAGRPKKTPVLVPDGKFERDRVLAMFAERSVEMDRATAELVIGTLREFRGETGGEIAGPVLQVRPPRSGGRTERE